MTTYAREFTAASLSVSHDTGHGGGRYHYRIDCRRGGYEVSATISRLYPAPGEKSFQPSTMTQVLHKDDREAADFLAVLAREHKVFELEGRACPHAFLHPTFYSFDFTDSEGTSHVFEYSIEAGRHHDDAYRGLVEEFERFFEAKQVAHSFYEREIRLHEPPGRGKRLRRKFRRLASLFFNR
ncbi:MAG TPA: hypothetical protein VF668_06635 [Pyrinomonadaceae bacterium]|jgi:hypothetical protein